MPRRGRKKMLGKRPDLEQERRADALDELAKEIKSRQRSGRRSTTPSADLDQPSDEAESE